MTEAVSADSQGYLLVNNDPILWSMLNAIKEQQALIRQQQAEIGDLTTRLANLEAFDHTQALSSPRSNYR